MNDKIHNIEIIFETIVIASFLFVAFYMLLFRLIPTIIDYPPGFRPKIDISGTKYWKNLSGEYHRRFGPAIIYNNESKIWMRNGKKHRKNGPAIEWNDGSKEWWVDGERHREDGPAIIYHSNCKLKRITDEIWYYHDKFIDCDSQEEFEKILKERKNRNAI